MEYLKITAIASDPVVSLEVENVTEKPWEEIEKILSDIECDVYGSNGYDKDDTSPEKEILDRFFRGEGVQLREEAETDGEEQIEISCTLENNLFGGKKAYEITYYVEHPHFIYPSVPKTIRWYER